MISASLASPPPLDPVLQRLDARELDVLLDFCDLLAFTLPDYWASRRRYLDLIGDPARSPAMKVCMGIVNRRARDVCDGVSTQRSVEGLRDFGAMRRRICARLAQLHGGEMPAPEQFAVANTQGPHGIRQDLDMELQISDDEFVMRVHEVLLERSCTPAEMTGWRERLADRPGARVALLTHVHADAARIRACEADRRSGVGPAAFRVMGTGQLVTEDDWQARCRKLAEDPARAADVPKARSTPYRRRGGDRPRVSVITSLYRGAAYVERFLRNMTAQSCFSDVELLLIDAASPEGEGEIIARWADEHPQIRYTRCNERIGIYAAWNLAIFQARGSYLTNANVDDLRREDSLELQSELLDKRPEIDVAYQDFYYTLDPTLTYEQVAAYGYCSRLPVTLDAQVLMTSNPPHHAPMWRKRLHDDHGLFDEGFQSAGDYEFWLRCLASGRRFAKLDEPHAVYFQNPRGMSTRADTPSLAESRAALRRHGRRLLADAVGVAAPTAG